MASERQEFRSGLVQNLPQGCSQAVSWGCRVHFQADPHGCLQVSVPCHMGLLTGLAAHNMTASFPQSK